MMKLGVFGDSYAEKNSQAIQMWWRRLHLEHGHDVTCFGEGASSITFSANLILNNYQDFDLVIWCVTCPGRISTRNHHGNLHFQSGLLAAPSSLDDQERQIISQTCRDFEKYVMDQDYINLESLAVVEYVRATVPNLLVIPAFSLPVKHRFNLFEVSCRELKYFGIDESNLHKFYSVYGDMRPAHMSHNNNQVLSDLLSQQLVPGMFTTDYDNFRAPDLTFDQCFYKK